MFPFSIVILVGTDHHAFQRAVDWADRRSAAFSDDKVFIQYGRTNAPQTADGAAFLSPAEMREAVAGADVVITHGGPGTISDARSGGHKPIVFPRDPQQGEHVDDHQQRFAAWCERRGLVRFARTTDDLDRILAELPAGGTREDRADQSASAEAIAAVGKLLDAPLPPHRVVPGSPVVVHLSGDQAKTSAAAAALAGVAGVTVLGSVGDLSRSHSHTCGCGSAFGECDLWTALGSEAFGGWGSEAARALSADAPQSTRRFFGGAREQREAMLAFAAPYQSLYQAAHRLLNGQILVDTTPGVAAALSHDARIDVRLLHLGGAVPRELRARKLPLEATSVAALNARPESVVARLVPGAARSAQAAHSGDARLSKS